MTLNVSSRETQVTGSLCCGIIGFLALELGNSLRGFHFLIEHFECCSAFFLFVKPLYIYLSLLTRCLQ